MDLVNLSPLWAVHILDGFVTLPWAVGGFVVAGLLALLGSWRVRDEEIPRIALLTAAFFVTSLIHVPVPVGPRPHLLLTGLVGVILGPRAVLAILVGLFLQAALFGHGGYTTLGINTCVMAIPALGSWLLFAGLRRLPGVRGPVAGGILVGVSAAVFAASVVYTFALFVSNPPGQSGELQIGRANEVILHPLTLLGLAVVAVVAGWLEKRLGNAPEFPLGLVVGEAAVLGTVALHSLVLLTGGQDDWHSVVLLACLYHLPLAVIEGLVLGFTLGFLARVKPEMIGGWTAAVAPPPALLLAVLAGLLVPSVASAHNLKADYLVKPDGTVTLECYFDITGDSPTKGTVKVTRGDGSLVAEGELSKEGVYSFHAAKAEELRVAVVAGDHSAKVTIPASAFKSPEGERFSERGTDVTVKDVLLGVTFLLALAGFLLGLRNARALRQRPRDSRSG